MRLITRANMDGVACGVLITIQESVERVAFANPQDFENGTVSVRWGDVIANLPYHKNAALWFDHHHESITADLELKHIKGKRGVAASTARLVAEYYDSPGLDRFEDLVDATDRIDSANLSRDDVLNPQGWVLLSMTFDPYDTAPAFQEYVNTVIGQLRVSPDHERLIELPEVKGRINRYRLDAEDYKKELQHATRMDGNVILTDFRAVDLLPFGNRFLAFALFPDGDVQIRLFAHEDSEQVRVRVTKSIFKKTCSIHLGELAAEFGGGGLEGSAHCLWGKDDAGEKFAALVRRLKK